MDKSSLTFKQGVTVAIALASVHYFYLSGLAGLLLPRVAAVTTDVTIRIRTYVRTIDNIDT